MKLLFMGTALAALSVAMTAEAQSTRLESVQFVGGPAQIARWAGTEAVAYGDDDTPLFLGPRDFVLAYAGNPEGRVHGWDAARQKVRITSEGQSGVWLACQDLEPMSIACESSFRLSDAGELVVDDAIRVRPPTRGSVVSDSTARGLPVCPADPRCPRIRP